MSMCIVFNPRWRWRGSDIGKSIRARRSLLCWLSSQSNRRRRRRSQPTRSLSQSVNFLRPDDTLLCRGRRQRQLLSLPPRLLSLRRGGCDTNFCNLANECWSVIFFLVETDSLPKRKGCLPCCCRSSGSGLRKNIHPIYQWSILELVMVCEMLWSVN